MIQRVAAIDFETTGIDVHSGQVIEGAVVLLEVDDGRKLARELDAYSSMNDPGMPIPQEVITLTGIDDEMVRGQRLDWERFNALVAGADLVVAHNARFDRAWLESFGKCEAKSWGCTLSMIEWKKEHGMPCATLKHLAWEHGYFPNAHRALDDVRTMIELLRMNARGTQGLTYFERLIESVEAGRRLVIARGSPFEKKDALKARQFSWAPVRKVWWRLLPETEWQALKPWLDEEIYGGRPLYESVARVDYLAPAFRAKYGLE